MRSFILAALTLAAAVFGGSCAPAPAAGEPALWRIRDADSEIWLFGSVHVLPSSVRWQGPRLRAAFTAADEFVTETDTSEEASAAFLELAQRYGTLPQGQALSALLPSQADRGRLQRAAREFGIDQAYLEGRRPWLAALQISYAYAERAGHSAGFGVETVLSAEARAQGKRLSFLETPEQQVRVLAGLPPEEELRFLLATIQETEGGDELLDATDAAWARGDTRTLARLLDAEWREGGAALHEAVVLRRNRAWADEIARRLDGSGRIFIAVGAAHLVGEGSVVALLRARGIPVEGP